MSLHDDLLSQARHLANRERRRPRQASLRRAISTAYYALFHLLVYEATSRLIAAGPARERFARAFDHRDMKNASRDFASAAPNLPVLTGGLPIPNPIRQVALAFVNLQEARHEADYNVTARFTRVEVNNLVTRVQQAFDAWKKVRGDPVAALYLGAMLLGNKWKR
jgi:uncharacterized protein (UPF0332 family)